MDFRNTFCYFCKNFVNISILFHFIFIVICNTENGNYLETMSQSFTSNVSSDGRLGHRERRSVKRGQNYYFQKSYEMNRLRHDLENRLRAPRHKPFFHTVNELYSYYLPPKFNKINANVENFSNKLLDNYDDNRSYATKTRSVSRGRGEQRFSLTRRVLPPPDYPTKSADHGVGRPLSPPYERDQQNYGPQYQRYGPRISSSGRGQPYDGGISSGGGIRSGDTRYGGDTRSGGAVSSGAGFRSGEDPRYGGSFSSGGDIRSGGGVTYSRSSSSSSTSLSDSSSLIPEPQNIVRNSTFPGIPGYQRVDFPGYSSVPYTGFRCSGQPYYGYYADVTAGCQVFHVCQPDGREYSFLCPNSTLFHQKVQTCDWWWHVDCPSSPRYYYLNARIGVLPPVDATLYRFPKA